MYLLISSNFHRFSYFYAGCIVGNVFVTGKLLKFSAIASVTVPVQGIGGGSIVFCH